jgi:hypothetical protein
MNIHVYWSKFLTPHFYISKIWKLCQNLRLIDINIVCALSLSHTEHTAYTVGHPCKPYIQPNELWPYPAYTRVIRLYPWKPCMIFKTFKKLAQVPCPCMIVLAIVQDRERPCDTVRDRIYNCTWSPLQEWAHCFTFLFICLFILNFYLYTN